MGIEAAKTDIRTAESGVRQAGALPNPSISIALERFGAGEIESGIEQTIELGGKRKLRTKAAEKDLEAARNNQKLAGLELEAEMARRFIPIAIDTRKLLLLDSIFATAEATRDQIRRRIEAGAARKADLIRAEIELDRLALERSEMVRQIGQARRKFAALGGKESSSIVNVSGSLNHDAIVPSHQDLQKAIAGSPKFKAIDIEASRLATERRQLKAEVFPDLDLSAGFLRNNDEASTSPLVGAAMTVPLFNRNGDAQRQIGHRQQALLQRRENDLRLLEAEVQDIQTRLLEIDRKVNLLTTGTIPKAESVYGILRDYYGAGSASFLDLVEAQSDLLQLQIELLDTRAERAQNLAALMEMTSLSIQIVK